MVNISFIVLNYNDAKTTISLVDNLIEWKKHPIDIHIIVVDNKSSDDSYSLLTKRYDSDEIVDVICSEKNGGYSYGNNFGVKFAIEHYNCSYIAIANPDIIVDYETIVNLIGTFSEDDNICMVAPVMKDADGNYSIHSQSLPSYQDDLAACFNSSKSKTINENNLTYINNNQAMVVTEMIPGSFFIVRADYFKAVDMFDENVFLFCEERIIGRKMKNCGYKSVIRSDLFFVHTHSVSIKKVYDTIKTWKILMESRYYYQKTYNRINFYKLLVLKISMVMFITCLEIKLKIYGILKTNGIKKTAK